MKVNNVNFGVTNKINLYNPLPKKLVLNKMIMTTKIKSLMTKSFM